MSSQVVESTSASEPIFSKKSGVFATHTRLHGHSSFLAGVCGLSGRGGGAMYDTKALLNSRGEFVHLFPKRVMKTSATAGPGKEHGEIVFSPEPDVPATLE